MNAEERLMEINKILDLYEKGLEKEVVPRATDVALSRGISPAAIRDAQLCGRFPTEGDQRNRESKEQEGLISIHEAIRQIRKLASGK